MIWNYKKKNYDNTINKKKLKNSSNLIFFLWLENYFATHEYSDTNVQQHLYDCGELPHEWTDQLSIYH